MIGQESIFLLENGSLISLFLEHPIPLFESSFDKPERTESISEREIERTKDVPEELQSIFIRDFREIISFIIPYQIMEIDDVISSFFIPFERPGAMSLEFSDELALDEFLRDLDLRQVLRMSLAEYLIVSRDELRSPMREGNDTEGAIDLRLEKPVTILEGREDIRSEEPLRSIVLHANLRFFSLSFETQ
jgi:hypothetical protein